MKRLFKALKIIVVSVLLLVLITNIYIIVQTKSNKDKVPSIFGYKPFIVLSGSMSPQFDVGDLIIIKKVEVNDLKKGDIIAFRDNENYVTTHRIIEIENQNNKTCFETKGDNNNTKDELIICQDKIEGKYHSKISKAGHLLLFIQKPMGFVVMMLTIFSIGLIVCLFENKKINKEFTITSEEEKKEFEEFKKQKEKNQKKKD